MEKKQKTLEDVKKEIRSLLISSPVGLRLQDLISDYRTMMGKQLPFKEFGYSSVLEMIKHMPDVVAPVFRPGGTMFLEAVADSTTKHIKKLVHQQKKSGRMSSIRRPRDESLRHPPPKPHVPALLRMKIKELLRSHPNGIAACSFGQVFKKRFNRDIDFQMHGHPSLKKFLENCSDIVDIITSDIDGKKSTMLYLKNEGSVLRKATEKGTQLTIPEEKKPTDGSLSVNSAPVRSNRAQPSSLPRQEQKPAASRIDKVVKLMDLEIEPCVDKVSGAMKQKKEAMISMQTGVSDQLKSEIRKLLERRTNGIWLARFPFEYKREYNKDLDIKTSGYLSLIALMGSLPETVKIDRPVENGDWLLHGVNNVTNSDHEDPIPKDAAKYDCIIQKMPHPTAGQIEIFIVQIDDPGLFYFHWFKKKESLDVLMGRMGDFYKSVSSQSYILPESHRKIGQVCAAVYETDGEWYRAMIVRVLSALEVEVVYVDYGDKAILNPLSLRFLKTEYTELPTMCLKGSLAKIKPLQSAWSPESATRFFQLTKDKVLIGRIHEIENESFSLDLVDTTQTSKIYINDTLVIEKHASYIHTTSAMPSPIHTGYFPNFMGPPSMFPFSNPSFSNAPLTMDSFVQQASSFMDPVQLAAMFPYLFTPIQQGQMILPPQQSSMNGALHRSASMPTPMTGNVIQRQSSQVHSEPESMESFIDKINSELDDVISDDGNFADDERSPEKSNNIKRIVCNQFKLHMIKYDGEIFVTRGEISALLWHKDILRQMLRQKQITAPSIVISREDHNDLFDELSRWEIKELEGCEEREFLTLYKLESLPLILDTFKHHSKELKKMIEQEINDYQNCRGSFFEEDEDSQSESSDDIEEDSMALELELEELRLFLQAMQFKRKRLLNALVSKTAPAEKVNELKIVEVEIERIRKKVQMKEGNFS